MNKITKRWFINNFVVILSILTIIEIFISLGIKVFYYSSVEKFIKSQAIAMLNLIDKSYNDRLSNFDFEIRSMVEDFEQKDKMEVMLLKSNGDVWLTSSGFDINVKNKMPDYDKIKKKDNDVLSQEYVQEVYSLNNENVMAVIYPIETKINDASYIRFVCSITNVDTQIILIIAATALIGVFIIFFVVMSM